MTPTKWKLTSIRTIYIEGWYVKPSITTAGTICIVMFNQRAGQTRIGFANDEDEANRFISCVVEQQSS